MISLSSLLHSVKARISHRKRIAIHGPTIVIRSADASSDVVVLRREEVRGIRCSPDPVNTVFIHGVHGDVITSIRATSPKEAERMMADLTKAITWTRARFIGKSLLWVCAFLLLKSFLTVPDTPPNVPRGTTGLSFVNPKNLESEMAAALQGKPGGIPPLQGSDVLAGDHVFKPSLTVPNVQVETPSCITDALKNKK